MKKVLAAMLALAMSLSLVACGGGEEPAPAPTPDPAPSTSEPAPAPAEKVDVTMIAAQYGNETQAWWENFVKEFNAANEGINLTVDVVSWNDIYT
ncbi:MAG: ABC transporter substrate-binding protein, partial [Clostridium sp.]|nr:ABC transporter substrate-binding protein [Clostridium sp.]